ncbi:hypothetical protein NCQ93_004116 [Salmonella enterica]|nr:hypothetical protein [Salmonella enterica]EEG5665106.1 hypothetical protein [Salmonella enterica]EHZ6790429.1 hypothetical protein [Salmonella enterica]EJH1281560.1 hypothetical protein [Salmonella enterica]EJH6248660.1 hypothetical protein [Salmonella enterica]
MEYIFAALIFALSVWVYKDARTRNIANPERWGVGTAFIFIIIAPLYFFKRKKLQGTSESYNKDDNVWQKNKKEVSPLGAYFLMFVLAFLAPAIGFFKGDLPACDSIEVHSVLNDLLNGATFSDAAQIDYDRFGEIRHCNMTTSDRVFSYTVKWYSDKKEQFVVQFEK